MSLCHEVCLLGLVGGPGVGRYSRSPVIHHASAHYLGLDAHYQVFEIPEVEQLCAWVEGFFAQGGTGLQVTAPYKTEAARLWGGGQFAAVNTLYKSSADTSVVLGLCTDGMGFEVAQAMAAKDYLWAPWVILGGGGVVAELLFHHKKLGRRAPVVVLCRRKTPTLESLSQADPTCQVVTDFTPEAFLGILAKFPHALVIQATSAPHGGEPLESFAEALAQAQGRYGVKGWVHDLSYAPCSALVAQSQQLPGWGGMGGMSMLMEQARASQQIWWGKSAPREVIEAAVLDMVQPFATVARG